MTRARTVMVLTALLSLSCAIGGAVVMAQRGADVALRAAVETETVKGDIRGAIAQYQRVIETYGKTDRPVAARALLHLAAAHQKLGDAQATQVYEQLIRDYGDQTQAVATARTRLTTLAPAARPGTQAVSDRVVKAGESITWGDGRVSPDGRFVSYTDWEGTGNLMLHDLVSGTDRALTANKDWSVGNASASTFSPDGKQLAYGWRTYGNPDNVNDLRIMNLQETGTPQSRRVLTSADVSYFDPRDWSSDGRWLAVAIRRADRTTQIAVVNVSDGTTRVLKSVGWRGPTNLLFSRDGRYLAYDLPANETDTQRDVFLIAVDGSREVPAVQHASDDVGMGWAPDGSRLLFASDRSGAVGLWTLSVREGQPAGAPTLLKPDIGSVLSQGLSASGALYIVRDASTLGLHVAPIDLQAGKLTGPPVLESFRSGRPDWSSDGQLIAYRSTGMNGLPTIAVHSAETGQRRELHPSLLYVNEPRWLPNGRSLVTAGRNFKGLGVIVRVDAETGQSTFITEGSAAGRVQVAPDGRKVYYGVGSQRWVERDLITGNEREVAWPRPTGTQQGNAELSPDGQSFAVIRDNNAAKTSTLSVFPAAGGEPRVLFSVTHPDSLRQFGATTWTPDNRAVIVMNTTGQQQDPKELWLVPVDGTAARRLDIEVRGWKPTNGIRLHPDGKHIAFFTGADAREVWALENVVASDR
jgi:Tol biopolymer transport system component